jgi:hypothetical protein
MSWLRAIPLSSPRLPQRGSQALRSALSRGQVRSPLKAAISAAVPSHSGHSARQIRPACGHPIYEVDLQVRAETNHMPIIRQPNQSYELIFGMLRLYLDDLDDVYRQLSECGDTTIGVGEDGVAPSIEDLRDSDKAGLRQIRFTTTAPAIIISFSPKDSSGVALKGEDSARRVIDNVASLLKPRRQKKTSRYLVQGILVILALVAGFINVQYTENQWIFWGTVVFLCADFSTFYVYNRVTERRPAVIPYRRREAALVSRERKGQLLIAAVSAFFGLITGIGITILSQIINHK